MRIEKANSKKIDAVAALLQGGGIIIYPTETVYGIGCLAGNEKGLARIAEIKHSPEETTYLVLIRDAEQMSQYAARIPDLAKKLAKRFWPGPLTLVLPAKSGLPPKLVGSSGGIGMRVSASRWCQALMAELHDALVSTSANLSGFPSPASLMELDQQVGNEADLVIDGGILPGDASTVVDLTGKRPTLIREGMIKADKIKNLIGDLASKSQTP
jgi:L-threonylcarbamoyladenylate synthase